MKVKILEPIDDGVTVQVARQFVADAAGVELLATSLAPIELARALIHVSSALVKRVEIQQSSAAISYPSTKEFLQ